MFCPIHGQELDFIKMQQDVAVVHDIYYCTECDERWWYTEFDDGKITMELSEEIN